MATIKEIVKKTYELLNKMGLGISYKEESKKLKGEFFIKLNHKDGRIEERYIPANGSVLSMDFDLSRIINLG